jgi:hypothetical protein
MLAILSIIIGLVFILLLFSMLASTVLELIDAIFSLRGRHLRNTLENMLGEYSHDFFNHPIFRQLCYAANNRNRISPNTLPGWVNKQTFSAIIADMMKVRTPEELKAYIASVDNVEMRKLMEFLSYQSGGTVEGFRAKVELWFEEIMQRATDWYKKNTKWWLFFIGFVLAGIFNADTIQIYQSLSKNAAARDKLTELAESFAAQRDTVAGLQLGTKSVEQSKSELQQISQTYTQIVQSPLGLGWSEQEGGKNLPWILVKLAGLLLTGMAVTLGAPFWFEMLKKLISIKNNVPAALAGKTSEQAASAPPPPVQQPPAQQTIMVQAAPAAVPETATEESINVITVEQNVSRPLSVPQPNSSKKKKKGRNRPISPQAPKPPVVNNDDEDADAVG